MAPRPAPPTWEEFVLTAPRATRVSDLAAVVGRPARDVQSLRVSGRVPSDDRERATFGQLFTQWHGRAPEDHEWPAPVRVGGTRTYEWQAPEDALLASLVGQMAPESIAAALSSRLQAITGDSQAGRNLQSVRVRMNRLGLVTTDVLGGLTVPQAGREYGSENVVRDAIVRGELAPRKVGRLLVIPHDQWAAWVAGRRPPPPDYIRLTTLKEPLGIRSDKLPEFARMGYVPEAILCHPNRGEHSGMRGTWYIPQSVADRLKADRRAGRPMPWHGKPLMDNLRATWAKWQERKHPVDCESCAQVWGAAGAPKSFDDYVARYPGLEHGAKRHLTMVWSPGLQIHEVAANSGRSTSHVALAIRNGQLRATKRGRIAYVARMDATLWIAAGAPCGDKATDWLAFPTASARYGYREADLKAMVADGRLESRKVPAGPQRGQLQVPWRQVAKLREVMGFTEAEAAAKVGVTLEEFRRLAEGTNWRGQAGIPLATIQAIIKRVKSESGLTIPEAAAAVGRSLTWVQARIEDGTVVLHSRPWSDRTYITDLGMEDLRRAAKTLRVASVPAGDWITGVEAAHLAGVSMTTVVRWSNEGLVKSRPTPLGRVHERQSVMAHARVYWEGVRFLRDTRPDWLKAERPNFDKPRRRVRTAR